MSILIGNVESNHHRTPGPPTVEMNVPKTCTGTDAAAVDKPVWKFFLCSHDRSDTSVPADRSPLGSTNMLSGAGMTVAGR
jgi:hypothetical protein